MASSSAKPETSSSCQDSEDSQLISPTPNNISATSAPAASTNKQGPFNRLQLLQPPTASASATPSSGNDGTTTVDFVPLTNEDSCDVTDKAAVGAAAGIVTPPPETTAAAAASTGDAVAAYLSRFKSPFKRIHESPSPTATSATPEVGGCVGSPLGSPPSSKEDLCTTKELAATTAATNAPITVGQDQRISLNISSPSGDKQRRSTPSLVDGQKVTTSKQGHNKSTEAMLIVNDQGQEVKRLDQLPPSNSFNLLALTPTGDVITPGQASDVTITPQISAASTVPTSPTRTPNGDGAAAAAISNSPTTTPNGSGKALSNSLNGGGSHQQAAAAAAAADQEAADQEELESSHPLLQLRQRQTTAVKTAGAAAPQQLQMVPTTAVPRDEHVIQLAAAVVDDGSCGGGGGQKSCSSKDRESRGCTWYTLCGPNPKKAVLGMILFLAVWTSLSIGFNLLKTMSLMDEEMLLAKSELRDLKLKLKELSATSDQEITNLKRQIHHLKSSLAYEDEVEEAGGASIYQDYNPVVVPQPPPSPPKQPPSGTGASSPTSSKTKKPKVLTTTKAAAGKAAVAPPSSSSCKTLSGLDCMLPFVYGGEAKAGCIQKWTDTKPWCATKVDDQGHFIKYDNAAWDYCDPSCTVVS